MCGISLLVERLDARAVVAPTLLDDASLTQQIEKRLRQRGPDHVGSVYCTVGDATAAASWHLRLFSGVLHLRGDALTAQPMEDASGSVLCWNGEVFGASDSATLPMGEAQNDTQWLLEQLAQDTPDTTAHILGVLRRLHGPFAVVYFHHPTQRVFFGHDRFGRRSLLSHTPHFQAPDLLTALASSSSHTIAIPDSLSQLVLSSVALEFPHASAPVATEEVPCTGLYVLDLAAQTLQFHPHAPLATAASDVAASVLRVDDVYACGLPSPSPSPSSPLEQAAAGLLHALSNSVGVRVRTIPPSPTRPHSARVGVLFSGGLDSVVLAALTHFHVADPLEPIDLLTVCFDSATGFQSPDRLAAQISHAELSALFPTRRWNFVRVDVPYDHVLSQQSEILSLLAPCDTHMDLNIGAAFWFLSRGQGCVSHTAATCATDVDLNGFLTANRVSKEQFEGEAAIQALELFGSNVGDAEGDELLCKAAKCKRKSKPGCAFGGTLCRLCCLKAQRLLAALRATSRAAERERFSSLKQLQAMLGGSEAKAERLRRTYEAHWPSDDVKEICRVHRQRKKQEDEEKTERQATATATATVTAEPCTEEAYTTTARVLLVGIGADEQLGGYGRHKTAYLARGSRGLRDELARDMQRIWKRNLGRDDRVISSHGREARFPFLDERVVQYIASLPLACVCDFAQARGQGDKLVLRTVARTLGLANCAGLAKRAIQFGTRIAKHANVASFGSNRQASGNAKIVRHGQNDNDE